MSEFADSISIPYGAIKSHLPTKFPCSRYYISIPYGAIKRMITDICI